ncbi:MAG: ARPP-1 family domain-containing protein [Rhodothermia bacterium]
MMNDTVRITLSELEAGKVQSNGAMTVLPLFDPTPRTLTYITLGQALAAGKFRITEISEGGSVPELMAINLGDKHVLLLDSEEVAGAKQNRVFNSSILVAAKSKIRIPVSCTEQGRWGYARRDFRPSGHVMMSRARANKKAHVSASLRMACSFAGNQSSVWEDVQETHYDLGTTSRTGAMTDAFDARKHDIEGLAGGFKPREWQSGVIVSVDGRLVGFDYVSDSKAFVEIYPKLMRSYAMESLLSSRPGPARSTKRQHNMLDQVRALLDSPESATESLHKSVGLGKDYRYSSSHVVGSALIHEDEIAHMAFLPLDGGSSRRDDDPMRNFRRRRFT